jgi:CO dehydrogenase/acetyl-CoA synthase beta subunit
MTMDIFDDCIKEVRDWFRRKEYAGMARTFQADPIAPTPNDNGDGGNAANGPGIIFKEDTAIELGHPSVGSCAAVLTTRDASLVEGARITLVGPDIAETDEKMLPFAQIAVGCCEREPEEACSEMDRILHVSARMTGYMLRSVPDMIWARVSKDAVGSGFSLKTLGSRLIASANAEGPGISGIEMFFATGSRSDVAELGEIVAPARDKLTKIKMFGRGEDGSYQCDTTLDCIVCPEKSVCDTIRDVITIRKGNRVITFGDEDKKR